MTSAIKIQYLVFDGSVPSVMTLTFAPAATWRENTTVSTSLYEVPSLNSEGMHMIILPLLRFIMMVYDLIHDGNYIQ